MLRRLTLLLACAFLSGCLNRGEPPRPWVAGDMVHLTERTRPSKTDPAWDAGKRTARLFSAANETVGFQLVLDAAQSGADRVRLTVGPLSGPGGRKIDIDRIGLFRMLPVEVNRFSAWYIRLTDKPVRPVRFYDVLVPIKSSHSFKIDPGGRLAVWVDVAVPRDAPGGEYSGQITIRSGGGAVQVNVALKVYNFVLPDARPVACIGGFSHKTIFSSLGGVVPLRLDTKNKDVRAALTIIRQLMRLSHDHRVDLFDKSIHPVIKRDLSGGVVLRWDDYDSIVKPYLDGSAFDDRIGVSAWPAPLWRTKRSGWPDPANYGGADTDAYRETAAAVLDRTIKHFDAIGMGDRLFVWPRTIPAGADAYERHAALARLVRSVGTELPILSELPSSSPPRSGWTVPKDFTALADMYAPPADLVAPAEIGRAGGAEHLLSGLWLRPSRPPYLGSCGLPGSPADIRALAWMAMKYDCPGIFLPEVLDWSGGSAGGEPERLFYPGKGISDDAVLPSVRLKRLRRGLQDAAYLWLLRKRDMSAVTQTMIDTMVHYAGLDAAGDHYLDARLDGWVRDGNLWVDARRILAEEVLSAIHPSRVTSRQLLGQRLAWKQLLQRACRVRLERLRCRVVDVAGGRFRAVIKADLYNERPHPVEVEIRISSLPAGWRPVEGGRARRSLAGGERLTVELAAEGDCVPTGTDARMNIPLVMTTDLHRSDNPVAAVPFIRAGFVKGDITIDGNLSDWPMREGNTAANFIALGHRGRQGRGLARRQTAVLALYDDRNLYLAFRCDEPDEKKTRARADNIVRYDQLLAVGEDLVELIVDPGGKAKDVRDLYHLLVKSNGVVVAERGVGAIPEWSGAWPVKTRVAVAGGSRIWTVEMAIPLKAFGAGGDSPTWGINFTRFSTAESEASSWAGAERYFYSPENLGTIYLAPRKRKKTNTNDGSTTRRTHKEK